MNAFEKSALESPPGERPQSTDESALPKSHSELVEIRGHIIDSLLLPKVLDLVLAQGGRFDIEECRIGSRRVDPSVARIRVSANDDEVLARIVNSLIAQGATLPEAETARFVPADIAGTFPEGFYSTSNHPTQVSIGGKWVDVAHQEMDVAIVLEEGQPRCMAMADIQVGMPVMVGYHGVRVRPAERTTEPTSPSFGFMSSAVSSERPRAAYLKEIARHMRATRQAGKRVLLVGGPAIVHTGSGEHVSRMIREGWLTALFAGNALATHDIEQAIFGTSLGISVDLAKPTEHGHEHHLRTINSVRRAGGIVPAVRSGLISSGIMYECVKNGVPYLLTGSIRDDGPLPDVVTDMLVGQTKLRELVRDVGFCIIVATGLHGIATGNVLPSTVPVAVVDINPAIITKLHDRGTFQTIGIVTDVQAFLAGLAEELTEKNS
jgi:lysine-ketoglutarate reductase/saccharopine dehydrogenase-like protein (TIGR00300 family)